MKLIIQIPCYNEEDNLPITVNSLPKSIDGIDEIKTLVINDGSTDNTLKVARKIGVDYVITLPKNKGLAKAFSAGIDKSLSLGADIIVNTDADNQYYGDDIKKLIKPILNDSAELVVGVRPINQIDDFSWLKKKLQVIGSFFVRKISNTTVEDTVSGFRALTRSAAFKINIFSGYSYTIENLIQFGYEKINIVSVPVRTNRSTRKSRLFKSIPAFIINQLFTIVRAFSTYKPLKVFSITGFFILFPGTYGFARFLYFYFKVGGEGHIQSLIFSTVLIIIGFMIIMFGLLADLISTNRKLAEKSLSLIKKVVFENKINDED